MLNSYSNEKSEARSSESEVSTEVKSSTPYVYPPEVHDKLIIIMCIFNELQKIKSFIWLLDSLFFFFVNLSYIYQE